MTISTDLERKGPGARAPGSRIVVGSDRSTQFRRARRHSILVRLLRFTFPIGCLAVAGIYVWSLAATSGIATGLPPIALPRITPQDLTMQNPHYEGFNKDGGTYAVAAKSASRQLGKANIVNLVGITGEMIDANRSKTNLTAARGTFDHVKSILELFEKIDIVSEGGMKAALTQATVKTKDGLVTSKEPVRVTFPAGTIEAKELSLHQKSKEVAFINDVRARLTPPKEQATTEPTNPEARQKLFGGSTEPVTINSSRLDVNDGKKTAIFTGNVRAAQAGATLQTPEMTVIYTGEPVEGAAPSQSPAASPDAISGKVQRILAKGPVAMTRGPAERVTSDAADFDAVNETAVLAGNVIMTAGPERRAVGDQATLDQRAGTALLTGGVVITQGQNILKGQRLFVDRTGGRTQLSSPGGGRITARFVQAERAAGKTAPEASEANAGAVTFKTTPGTPLDIEAAQLDVNDAAKVATFSGNVTAKQGDFVIKSAELQAHYTGSASLADVGGTNATQAAAKPDEPGAELSKVRANTKVVMTSTDGRKVTGDWAEFDAKTNKAVVGGDVELFQGQSVVRGTRLLIDLTTGKTTMDVAPAQTVSSPAGGGWVTDGGADTANKSNSGRPSAIFFPNELKQTPQKKKAPPASAGVPDGWQTRPSPN